MERRKRLSGLPAVLALCGATAILAPAQTFSSLFSFDGTNGQWPIYSGALVQGLNGELYGTTFQGGKYNCGRILEVTRAGTFTTLYNFCMETNCTDGSNPAGPLIQAANGNFYGTTERGGANGHGTVFRMTPGGALTTLYSFCNLASCADGQGPVAGLVQGSDGNFYGTTSGDYGQSPGTVFKMTPAGVLTTLYTFFSQTGWTDGA